VRGVVHYAIEIAISCAGIHAPHTIDSFPSSHPTMNPPCIILFDNQCNVCNTFMQFVIRRDPTEQFLFMPLKSEQAARALQAAGFQLAQSDLSAPACVSTLNTALTSSSTSMPPQTSPPNAAPTPPPLDSIMLICQGKVLLRSDAVLAIARGLRFPWPLLSVFRIVPRPIRDGAYRIVARNRYRWFGQCNVGA